MKNLIYLTFALIIISGASCTSPEYRIISVEKYMDKAKAGWVGQMAGVGWGGPTEFKWNGVIIPSDQLPQWNPEMSNQFYQDDIYVEMTFLRTLEQHGFDVSIRQAGIDFANSKYMLWHANKAGRDNLRSGIAPPWSGHPEYNNHADDIDYQIEADYAGLISPGMPAVAIELGDIFGKLMNYGDGLYGGNFVAGMYAEAFFESDIEKIIQAGLKCVPEGSQYYEAITDVIRQHQENPDDWIKAWEFINEKYNKDPEYRKFSCSGPGDFNIDAKINGAYIVMGLLYGKGDMDETIIISTRCGQDSDCNPANSAGILATTIGFKNLPDKFTSALDYSTKFSYTDYNLSELIAVNEKLARQAVLRTGGKIETGEDGKEYFHIPIIEPDPGKLVQCWEPEPVAEDVHYNDEEMNRISIKIIPPEAHMKVWKVSGPYKKEGLDNTELFDEVFDPETDLNKAKWEEMPFGNGYSSWIAELDKLYNETNAVAYLSTEIHSETAQKARFYLGSDDGIKVWLNGTVILEKNVSRGLNPDEDFVDIELAPGWNTLLLKVTQGEGGWQAAAVICDLKGNPLEDLEFR